VALTDIEDQPGVVSHIGDAMDPFDGYEDYFGFDQEIKYVFPDGKQYIVFKPLTEGQRAKYEAITSRDIKFNRRTDDAAIHVNTAEDRHALINASVTGWHIVRKTGNRFEPVAFSKDSKGSTLEQWLNKANPRLVNELVDAIRKANPWMTEDMTVEMIDDEIRRLQELRATVAENEAKGKSS
jgi:hypothetical protein